MIRKFQKEFFALDCISDLVLVYLSYILVSVLSANLHPSFEVTNISMTIHPWAELFSVLLVVIYLAAGVYNQSRYHGRRKKMMKIIIGNVIGILIIGSLFFLTRIVDYSRYFIFMFGVVTTIILCAKHALFRTLSDKAKRSGKNVSRTVIIGSGSLAEQCIDTIKLNPEYGYRVIGTIGSKELSNAPFLGDTSEIDTLLKDTEIDEVLVCPSGKEVEDIDHLIIHVEKSGIPCSIIPSFNNSLSAKFSVGLMGDMKVINLRDNPLDNPFNAFVKRTEDIVLSLILIVVTSPLMVIAFFGVKFSSPGPVLFKQERVGYHRKNFRMLKFRSMRLNAQSDTAWSTGVDNRRTKFGSFIRKTSIDELPQFFNVLKGDMSLIGPRPEIPHFVDEFRESIPKYMVKHQVKPGITGWAQVHGFRGDTSIEGRITYDIFYIEHWSLWLDVKIILMTIFGGMINKEKLS